jgi:putative DNA primase/helicase
VRLGFGERREIAIPDTISLDQDAPDVFYRNNDLGNAQYLYDCVGSRYHWIKEEKTYYRWDGRVWQAGADLDLEQDFRDMTQARADIAEAAGNDAAAKRWVQAGNVGKTKAALEAMRSRPGVAICTTDLSPDRNLLNVGNGILDLRTQKLTPHEPAKLMTRMFAASYDPGATCPEFQDFMIAALPDPEMRTYVQRALGYSLLGDVDQRSIFWIYGPPGTGKSTLMDTIRFVFGDYGSTASSGAFRSKGKDHGPSNDLHGLRGKRFVTTSETAETTSFDEDLLKRLSGRDQVTSRDLYQANQEWTPECVLWMATNNAPRFSSDDDAIWRRTKLIPFLTVFTGDAEVPDFARRTLAPERNGILNWLLEGLRDYLLFGLGEPVSVLESAKDQRSQSDSVARFIDERVLDGVLVEGDDQRIRTGELYAMYTDWVKLTGERAIGSRRFVTRMLSNFPTLAYSRLGGHYTWQGLGRAVNGWILGSAPPTLYDD